METVKKREKEFHDRYYSSGGRERALKFNAVQRTSQVFFEQQVKDLSRGKSVLEIGCGEGGLACRVATVAAEMTGIDISEVAVTIAQKKAEKVSLSNVSFTVMDGENLAFDDSMFDVIYGISVLHHLNIVKTYRETARLLKPGGTVIFLEPLGHNPLINAYRRLTPGMRTRDEHPLLLSDIKISREYFHSVNVRYFNILSICAAPLYTTPFFMPVLRCLEAIDNMVFSLLPYVRRYAWTAFIMLSEPHVSMPDLEETTESLI